VFGNLQQPSGQTLRIAMQRIQRAGQGTIVYLRHEKMGQGLLRTLQTLRHHRDASFAEAPEESPERLQVGSGHATPGTRPPANKLDYGIGSQILRDLGIRQMRLLTNHPFHPRALSGFGLEIVDFEPVTDEAGNPASS
jgi:3,4-dihydroxy 2-butanone 4-phosphate synthase/GTP cyclohydrolase II